VVEINEEPTDREDSKSVGTNDDVDVSGGEQITQDEERENQEERQV
jgi:hypothetical protein